MKKLLFFVWIVLSSVRGFAQWSKPHHNNGHHHYKKNHLRKFSFRPRFHVPRLSRLPRYARLMTGPLAGFYCSRGVFYRQMGSFFIPVRVPAGIFFPVLWGNAQFVRHMGVNYWVSAGNFYRECDGGYVSTEIPQGICINEIPVDELLPCENQEDYFIFHDQLWERQWCREIQGFQYKAVGPFPG